MEIGESGIYQVEERDRRICSKRGSPPGARFPISEMRRSAAEGSDGTVSGQCDFTRVQASSMMRLSFPRSLVKCRVFMISGVGQTLGFFRSSLFR